MSTRLGSGKRRARVEGRCRALVLLSAVLLLTACADDPETVVESAEPTPSAGASSEPTTPAGTPSADPSASPTSSDDYQLAHFVTPTGNIRCSLGSGPEGDGVRCDIRDKQWESPPKAADCEFDWGYSLYLTEEQSGFACVSDAIDPVEPLPYGETEALGRVECTSRQTGVRCEHLGSGHGFELSRARYSLF